MTNLAKSLELATVKTGKYGRKYYDSGALIQVKDKQIEAQTDQVKQTSVLLSQSHALTLQAQKRQDDE